MAVFLDADRLVHGVDEVLVRFFQCFYIDDATLGFPGHVAGVLFEDLGVPEQQCVGGVCDVALELQSLLLAREAQRHDHLAFPQRNGLLDGGLDLVGQELVIILDQFDLRCGLDSDGPACLQVVHFFLELADGVLEVADQLGMHRIPAFLYFGAQGRDGLFAEFADLLFPGGDVDLELFEVLQVFLIQGVEHADVPEHLHTRFFQFPLDPVHLDFEFFVLDEKFSDLCAGFLEDTEDPGLFVQ